MTHSIAAAWIALDPDFGRSRKSKELFCKHARRLRRVANGSCGTSDFWQQRDWLLNLQPEVRRESWPSLVAAGLLLTDLVEQGWEVRIRSGIVEVLPSTFSGGDVDREKEIIQRQELIKRNAQLEKDSVQRFLRSMEQHRLFKGKFVSIFSLMRDGQDLADRLRQISALPSTGNGHTIFGAIEPYIEFVTNKSRCKFTGIRHMDIWRYFRHTWTNQYTSVPGRTIMFLVRDASVESHPIIGISAISSPVIQMGERDKWIGWHPDSILEEIRLRPTKSIADWLVDVVDTGIREIYIADLIKDKLLSRHLLNRPKSWTVQRLYEEGKYQRDAHHKFMARSHYGELNGAKSAPASFWRAKAQTHLFRSKRAYALSSLLNARIVLNEYFGDSATAEKLSKLIETGVGRNVIRKISKKAKADRVGIAMADISVCGAVAPYNHILGGKLVSMLTASPEVVREYQKRYGSAESEIASSIAGRPIVRPANLVFLSTTSLYGTHASQYNRIRIPSDCVDSVADEDIKFHRLGRSESFGTSHFSDKTVQALVALVQHAKGGQRVNSIFGEGASPKLRKVREGLDSLGLPSGKLLRHGRKRIIYGIPLVTNVREYLLGRQRRPRYILKKTSRNATRQISEWWMLRWLKKRIQSESVLEKVASHTLVHPIVHGARVSSPHSQFGEDYPGPSGIGQNCEIR